jgi:hypothetical protein
MTEELQSGAPPEGVCSCGRGTQTSPQNAYALGGVKCIPQDEGLAQELDQRRVAMRTFLMAIALSCLASLSFLRNAQAQTDYNVDVNVPPTCQARFAGLLVALEGNPTVTGQWNNLCGAGLGFQAAVVSCGDLGTVTLVSWACPVCLPNELHVGFSAIQDNVSVINTLIYNSAYVPCSAPNVNSCDDTYLSCKPSRPSPTTTSFRYHRVQLTNVAIHMLGKTITISNSPPRFPSATCRDTVYVGKVRFEYYSVRQPLSTLNSTSVRHPIRVDSIPGGPRKIPCSGSLTLSFSPPDGAKYLVVSTVSDTSASLGTVRRTRAWEQVRVLATTDVTRSTDSRLLLYVSPNPARQVLVEFTLPYAGPVEVAIFDVAGRRVATLLRTSRTAGRFTERWDGRDDRGLRAPAGVYLVQLIADGLQMARHVTLLR